MVDFIELRGLWLTDISERGRQQAQRAPHFWLHGLAQVHWQREGRDTHAEAAQRATSQHQLHVVSQRDQQERCNRGNLTLGDWERKNHSINLAF